MSTRIDSERAPEPVGLYPHARQVGNLLFLSGVGPRQRGSKDIPGVTLDADRNIIAYNIEVQCRTVFKNVKMILEEAGSSWDQLVDVTVFLTNMKADFATYNKIYAEYFQDNQPCRTTVEISSLPTPIAIELKCIATIDSTSRSIVYTGEHQNISTPAAETQNPVSIEHEDASVENEMRTEEVRHETQEPAVPETEEDTSENQSSGEVPNPGPTASENKPRTPEW